jgi:hypothetical protein
LQPHKTRLSARFSSVIAIPPMTVAGGVPIALNHGDLFMFKAPKNMPGNRPCPEQHLQRHVSISPRPHFVQGWKLKR